MKKILYVELSSGFGGSSEALFSALRYLDRKKFCPVLLISRPGKNFDRITESGVDTIHMTFLNTPSNCKDHPLLSYVKTAVNLALDVFINSIRVWKIIRKKHIDLVHINTIIDNNFQSILAAKWAGVPCVCHIRETKVQSRLEKYFKRFLDRILVLNKEAYAIAADGYDPQKLILLPDGIELGSSVNEEDLQNIRRDFGLKDKFCIGILGRLVEGKGQDDFIRAASLVAKTQPNAKFLIIGNDPDKNHSFEQKLRSLAQELHLDGQMVFTGWRTDKNEMLSVLDIVVQASSTYPEGTPLVCLEAMVFKKPVVATDIPGSNAMVADGITGLLVPRANPELLASAILKIMENPALAHSMAEAGKRRVHELFDIKDTVKKIENIYTGVLTKK